MITGLSIAYASYLSKIILPSPFKALLKLSEKKIPSMIDL